MLFTVSIEANKVKALQRVYCDIEGYEKNFPILIIDKYSYIVSAIMETGINLKAGGVHNLHIGKFCSIAHDIRFTIDLNHDYSNVTTAVCELFNSEVGLMRRKGQILIENDVWIGRGVSIVAGVTIHNGAIIAANSHVVKDVPPYAIVGGNPAKIIKYRFDNEIIRKIQSISWWEWENDIIKTNLSLYMNNIQGFCNRFYKEDKLLQSNTYKFNFNKDKKKYLFFLDIKEKHSIWNRVIIEFSKLNEDNCTLILYIKKLDSIKQSEVLASVQALISEAMKNIKNENNIEIFFDEDDVEKAIFKEVNYFISSRSIDTIKHSQYAYEYGVEVISGVDIPIF